MLLKSATTVHVLDLVGVCPFPRKDVALLSRTLRLGRDAYSLRVTVVQAWPPCLPFGSAGSVFFSFLHK